MSILVVKASKPLADSKLGFTYSLTAGDSCTVTSVKKNGLFGGSDLRKGHEVLLINGSSTRIGIQDMRDLLKSLPSGTVTLIVRAPPSDGAPAEAGEAVFKLGRKSSVTKNKMLETLHRSVMKQEIDAVPRLLQDRGVPEQEWFEIYTMVGRDLLSATDNYVTKKDTADRLRDQPPHAESRHTHTQTHVGALHKSIIAHQKCMIAASEVKARANAILAKYNIVASEVYEKLGDEKVTTGLKFRASGAAPAEAESAKKTATDEPSAVEPTVAEPAAGTPSLDSPATGATASDAPAPAADAVAADAPATDKDAAAEVEDDAAAEGRTDATASDAPAADAATADASATDKDAAAVVKDAAAANGCARFAATEADAPAADSDTEHAEA